jgi:hypothetical protein
MIERLVNTRGYLDNSNVLFGFERLNLYDNEVMLSASSLLESALREPMIFISFYLDYSRVEIAAAAR